MKAYIIPYDGFFDRQLSEKSANAQNVSMASIERLLHTPIHRKLQNLLVFIDVTT